MNSEMEKILGGPIGFDKTIPGSVPISGKEFVYYCDDGRNPVRQQFSDLTQYTNPPHAQRGGVTSQGCSLVLPDGSIFHAIAYHGDLDGWRRDIKEGAAGLKIVLARIDNGKIVTSDGREFELSACIAKFE